MSKNEAERKELKRTIKSKALAVFTAQGDRVAYGWEVDKLMALIDAYAERQSLLARIDFINENYPTLDTDSENQNYNQINWIVKEVRDNLTAQLNTLEKGEK